MNPRPLSVRTSFLTAGATLLSLLGCGEGNVAPLPELQAVRTAGAVVVRDEPGGRLLFLSASSPLDLAVESAAIGPNLTAVVPSADGSRVYALTRGVLPRVSPDTPGPEFVEFDGSAAAPQGRRLRAVELDAPLGALRVDPEGEWVVAFGGSSTISNPNELILLPTNKSELAAIPRTLRSFGGSPVDVTFTRDLLLPTGEARRLLVVRTDRDISLLDLAHLDRPETTAPLSTNGSATVVPAQVVVSDGDPADSTDARIAVRLEGKPDVVLLQLGPSDASDKDFSVLVNIIDVGGVPSAIDFVETDAGIRLAALVPTRSQAVLVDPATAEKESVELPAPFTALRPTDSGDVALLWGGATAIGFWSLSAASGTPYRSVSMANLGREIARVEDVPSPNAHLKLLSTTTGTVYVLDMKKRQTFPFETTFGRPEALASGTGTGLWVYQPGAYNFAFIELPGLHARALDVAPPVALLFDVATKDGGRASVALHTEGGLSATLLDGTNPDSTRTKFYPALAWRDAR